MSPAFHAPEFTPFADIETPLWERITLYGRAAVFGILAEVTAIIYMLLPRADLGALDRDGSVYLLAGPITAVAYALYELRVSQYRRTAKRLGFSFTRRDTMGIPDIPIPAFTRLGLHTVENVLSGVWDGMPVWIFQYDYRSITSSTNERYTGVLVSLKLSAPAMAVEPEDVTSRVTDLLLADDIHFESQGFNEAFRVRCDDRRFATSLIDARMMDWLLENDSLSFQLFDHSLVVMAPHQSPTNYEILLDTTRDFVRRIPRAALSLYAPGPTSPTS